MPHTGQFTYVMRITGIFKRNGSQLPKIGINFLCFVEDERFYDVSKVKRRPAYCYQ